MWFWFPTTAVAAPVSEELCVTVESREPTTVRVDAPPPELTAFRAATARSDAPPVVPTEALLAAVPPPLPTVGFEVRAAAALDPRDPSHAWLAVVGTAPAAAVSTLRLTLVIDASPSMDSVFLRALPPMQSGHPGAVYAPVSRLELARASLHDLVDRLPPNATVSVVGFVQDDAVRLLGPTEARERVAIHEAIDHTVDLHPAGGTILDLVGRAALVDLDRCADNRILLVTDDNAHIDVDPARVRRAVADWRSQGIELWTLSLGMLGQPVPDIERITADGGGLHLAADTFSEATEQLAESLRAAGTVARAPAVTVSVDPERVVGLRRIGEDEPMSGADGWVLPATVDAGWREAALYALELAPGGAGPVASVTWSVSSPVPGEWTRGDTLRVEPEELAGAPAFLRDRYVAALVGETMAGRTAVPWDAVVSLGDALASERGTARELVAWAHVLERAAETP